MLGDEASCKLCRHASRCVTCALYATLRAEQFVSEFCLLPGLNGENNRECHKNQRELRVSAGSRMRPEVGVMHRTRIAGAVAPRSRTRVIASSLDSRLSTREQRRSGNVSKRYYSPCAQLATSSAFTTTADRIDQWSSTATRASSMPPPATESRESTATHCPGRRTRSPMASAIGADTY